MSSSNDGDDVRGPSVIQVAEGLASEDDAAVLGEFLFCKQFMR